MLYSEPVRHGGFLLSAILLVAAILAVYTNHFRNTFHFDDYHTIKDNPYVHNIRNIPLFFKDARTFSTRPDHDSYRPIVSSLMAVAYWMGGTDPVWYHVIIFSWFLALLAVVYVFFAAVMNAAAPGADNRWFALFGTALFGLHPVSAETVNYIIQSAEIFSSFGVVAGLAIYIRWPRWRRSGLYLLPVIFGILSKPPAAVFAPILFLYILLFEANSDVRRPLKSSLPALAACGIAGALVTHLDAPTFLANDGSSPWLYRLTQPSVMWHYFRSFFWPSGLIADSGFTPVRWWGEWRVACGSLFVVALLAAGCLAVRRIRTRPIAFGIAWFVLALIPVAWAHLAEVENDHRMFFPLIGLTLAVVWEVRITIDDRRVLAVGAVMVLAACGYGTYMRNRVWHSEESLWRDAVEKNPHYSHVLMNYGSALGAKGDFGGALTMFRRGLALTPDYALLHLNTGVAYVKLGRGAEAEREFRRAVGLAPGDPQFYALYAQWLAGENRVAEAVALAESGLRANPKDMRFRALCLQWYARHGDISKLQDLLADSLRIAPDDPQLAPFLRMRAGFGAPQVSR